MNQSEKILNDTLDCLFKLRCMARRAVLLRLHNEAIKLERKFNIAIIKALEQWEKDFNKFFTKTKQLELFRRATPFFPNGRNIIFDKSGETQKAIEGGRAYITSDVYGFSEHDHLAGIDVYQPAYNQAENYDCDYPVPYYPSGEKLKVENEDVVEETFRDFEFDIGPLAETIAFYNTISFNATGNTNVISVGSEGFKLVNNDIINAIENRANKLAGNWAEGTWLRLKNRIAESYFIEGKHPIFPGRGPKGGKISSIADDIIDIFGGNYKRAKTVARTETAVMQSEATWIFNQRSGIQKHGWAATLGDGKTREEHKLNHAQVRIIGEPFPNGQLRVGEGKASQVVNCRCANYAVIDGTIDPWDGSSFEDAERMINKDKLFELPDIKQRPVKRTKPKPVIKERKVTSLGRTFNLNNENEHQKYMLWQWAHGSKRKTSEIMKIAAKDEFNLTGKVWRTRKTEFNIKPEDIIEKKKLLRNMYNTTQSELADKGLKTVRLYRGTKTYYSASEVGVIESWTSDVNIASLFNGGKIYYEDIPVDKILSYHKSKLWRDGKYGKQFEYLVMR